MKLEKIRIKNFRGYNGEIDVSIGDMTAFVGQNDAGKSTILEALDIFFNDGKGVIRIDKNDLNVKQAEKSCKEVEIACIFSGMPKAIVIDNSAETSFKQEYMLNREGFLEVVKKYKMTSDSPKATVYIKALLPRNPNCSDLLSKTRDELRKILDQFNINCNDRRECASMRSAIWAHFSDSLDLQEELINISAKRGQVSEPIWNHLRDYLPVYSLFRSDRKNSDGDSEVQDPLREAVKSILKDEEIITNLNTVAGKVRARLQEIADSALDMLKGMKPDVAETLKPQIPDADALKWSDVFKGLSITGDENIPINKRGSGIRRLIFLNFFRAEVIRKTARGKNNTSVIYAIEEPETSQHIRNQKILIDTLKELSKNPNTQVILTTHSSTVVKNLDYDDIRIVNDDHSISDVKDNIGISAMYKSLLEINYLAFKDPSEEYHDALYGELSLILHEKFRDTKIKNFEEMLKEEGFDICETWRKEKEEGKKTKKEVCRCAGDSSATKRGKEENVKVQKVTLQTYIRHSIHHPENKLNKEYTPDQLAQSIEAMRNWLIHWHTKGYHPSDL